MTIYNIVSSQSNWDQGKKYREKMVISILGENNL
jgi:hypothetical protein